MVVTPALRCLALTTHTCTGAVEQMERAQKSGRKRSIFLCENMHKYTFVFSVFPVGRFFDFSV